MARILVLVLLQVSFFAVFAKEFDNLKHKHHYHHHHHYHQLAPTPAPVQPPSLTAIQSLHLSESIYKRHHHLSAAAPTPAHVSHHNHHHHHKSTPSNAPTYFLSTSYELSKEHKHHKHHHHKSSAPSPAPTHGHVHAPSLAPTRPPFPFDTTIISLSTSYEEGLDHKQNKHPKRHKHHHHHSSSPAPSPA
uniref:Uncharacterized histidine-rich protein DDB_G0274557-like n=1 Tax=Cicer arietinum TaxID=3827 RepID=A0A1S2Z5E7_CICAR|nr:uncharacterized histidine-rich protein DDB_G0274557-like [Cicer arietinum]